MFKTLLSTFFLLLQCSPAEAAKKYIFTATNNTVKWSADATPGFLRITGDNGVALGEVSVDQGKFAGELSVDVRAFKTHSAYVPNAADDLRDQHMHEKYLESAKHPTATLKLIKVILDQDQFEGELTIKGVKSNVKGAVSLQGDNLKVIFKTSLANYPIGAPSYKGLTVANEVEITVNADFKK